MMPPTGADPRSDGQPPPSALTGLADAQRILRGVEHLVLVLLVDDLALPQVWRELGRVEDARELVAHSLHALPQLLAALLRPLEGGRGLLRGALALRPVGVAWMGREKRRFKE